MNAEDHKRCVAVLADTFHGEHNIPGAVVEHPLYLFLRYRGALSTFDFDELTRLVLAAHRHAVRVQIASAGMTVGIMLHPRQREGSFAQRHPTMAEAIAGIEKGATV